MRLHVLRHRPSPATLIALLALAVSFGGVAWATIPDSDGSIHGCYAKADGSLRVIDKTVTSCAASEKPISWKKTGPTGPAGPAGPTTTKTFGLAVAQGGSATKTLPNGITVTMKCHDSVNNFPLSVTIAPPNGKFADLGGFFMSDQDIHSLDSHAGGGVLAHADFTIDIDAVIAPTAFPTFGQPTPTGAPFDALLIHGGLGNEIMVSGQPCQFWGALTIGP